MVAEGAHMHMLRKAGTQSSPSPLNTPGGCQWQQ